MRNILTFDSTYILNPIRKIYIFLVEKLLEVEKVENKSLVLTRLDKNNVFMNHRRNFSSFNIGIDYDQVDSLSVEFYRYFKNLEFSEFPSINNVPLYQLYPRQVKLKLASVLRCALRLRNLLSTNKEDLEIITDKQTILIMKEAFLFLDFTPTNVKWKENYLLTICITLNSFIMRALAYIKMYVVRSNLPKEYFYKHLDNNAPTVLITLPKNRPEDFFTIYVKNLKGHFNVILYSLGSMPSTPRNYKKVKIKSSISFIKALVNLKNLFSSSKSYISDILLIFNKHADLIFSIDLVKSIYSNKINAHISRLQTNAVDTHLAVEARRKGIFILADVEEEVFYCDHLICPSESEDTESMRLSLSSEGQISYRGGNSMMEYRMMNLGNKNSHYLHQILGINSFQKIIFYVSDPSKEERQRYLTEKFLFDFFKHDKKFTLVVKTHPQDRGRVTNCAFKDSGKAKNIFLIGDISQKNKMISNDFYVIENFNFNSAISSSEGLLTQSSSSILQALILGVKTGVVDKFENGFHKFIINKGASTRITDETSLKIFLKNKKFDLTDDILNHFGLKNNYKDFDLGACLLERMEDFYENNEQGI